jgi:hypothetical protein
MALLALSMPNCWVDGGVNAFIGASSLLMMILSVKKLKTKIAASHYQKAKADQAQDQQQEVDCDALEDVELDRLGADKPDIAALGRCALALLDDAGAVAALVAHLGASG